MTAPSAKTYTLLDAGGPYLSTVPGLLGGNRRGRIYGRLDCPAALRALAQGGYAQHRVFFADESAAIAAGYRPCGTCLREQYRAWLATAAPAPQPQTQPQPRTHTAAAAETGPADR